MEKRSKKRSRMAPVGRTAAALAAAIAVGSCAGAVADQPHRGAPGRCGIRLSAECSRGTPSFDEPAEPAIRRMAAPPAPPVTAAPVAPTVKAWPAAPRAGDYACSLQAGDHQYPTFRCRVYRAEDGSRVLEKMGGSQRFRGRIAPARRGFSFDGTFFCPSGDCTESVAAEFTAVGPGRYRGVMWGRSGPLGVSLEHMPGGFSDVGVTAAAAIAE